jgi:hypothetical protein
MFNWINSGNFTENGKDVQVYEIPEDSQYKTLDVSIDLPKGCMAVIDELGMITFMTHEAFQREYQRT